MVTLSSLTNHTATRPGRMSTARRDVLGMHPGLDRVHRPQSHLLQRVVVKLAAIVVAHGALLAEDKIKSAYLRRCW